MKIIKRQFITIALVLVFSAFVLGTENQYKKAKNLNQQVIRPNVADLNSQMKIIKPLIERPYIPQEVDRLAEPKRKIMDDASMQKAILLGPQDRKSGLEEVR
jgi:hypothetical protein